MLSTSSRQAHPAGLTKLICLAVSDDGVLLATNSLMLRHPSSLLLHSLLRSLLTSYTTGSLMDLRLGPLLGTSKGLVGFNAVS